MHFSVKGAKSHLFCYVHLKRGSTGSIAPYFLNYYFILFKLFLKYKMKKTEKQTMLKYITKDKL